MRTHVVIFMIDAVRVICPWICCITLWMYKPSTTFSACFWGISFTKSSNIWAWLIHSCVHFCYSPAQKSCENWAWAGSFKSQQIFLRTIKGIGAVLRWIIDYREREKLHENSRNLAEAQYLTNYTLGSIYVSAYRFCKPVLAVQSSPDHQHSRVNLNSVKTKNLNCYHNSSELSQMISFVQIDFVYCINRS